MSGLDGAGNQAESGPIVVEIDELDTMHQPSALSFEAAGGRVVSLQELGRGALDPFPFVEPGPLQELNVQRLVLGAVLPTRAHAHDAGLDLYAVESSAITAGARKVVGTGIAVGIPEGHVGLVHPRSGLASKHGVTVLNAPGTIDTGYTGEVRVILHNTSARTFQVEPGTRIAQLIVQRVELPRVVEVDSLEDSERGAGGFGSSGA